MRTLESRIALFLHRIARRITAFAEWVERDSCSECGERKVRYNDGHWDCPKLTAYAQQSYGGKADR